ncbi:uncharacterized protein E0L32_001693 [Thyridium curvatum]|uniref:FAD-binding domain-containing protein n=1 Tax=Thyridium curvatum TaxID=1093900 RepID=A0A507AQS8_9PEZI|nr:uncharacterized protein E0L32_001506 [Thyridium curvatum]XP_030990944.1 uncharacterized protein E0L32_001693 [Thyridium curvatum]TPX09046.1 hypothetical protein E0L32_001506 [Thyridium curvatum]TPX09233.1 hypothetical protein E0L32_001693 [Thyridium curvatum]
MSSQFVQKHPLAQKRIIVTGAGIAGLAFARALHLNWPREHPRPDVVLYERSAEVLDRAHEGYTMGIQRGSGLLALREIGLLDAALESRTTGSDGSQEPVTIWTKDWTELYKMPPAAPTKGDMPPRGVRLVRHALRQILLDGLPEETVVHWENACEWVKTREDGKVEIGLSDGSTDECDLLIAADGANSKVRECLLPDETLQFAGARLYSGTSKFPLGKPDALKTSWGFNVSGEGYGFLTFPIDSTTGAWALTHRSAEPKGRIRGDEAARRYDEIMGDVRRLGGMFDEPFAQVVEATDPVTLSVFDAMHRPPVRHARQLAGGANAILIGDANHAMSPFSGSGANMALMDAVALAGQLARCADLRAAIDAFDAESAPRSQKAIDFSWWVIRGIHARGVVFWLVRAVCAVMSVFAGRTDARQTKE